MDMLHGAEELNQLARPNVPALILVKVIESSGLVVMVPGWWCGCGYGCECGCRLSWGRRTRPQQKQLIVVFPRY